MPPTSRRAVAAVAISSSAALVAAVVALVVNVLMARLLGPGPRGEVALVLQGAYVIAPILALGADRQALREPRQTPVPSQRHVWVVGGMAMAVALLAGSWAMVACFATAAVGASMAIERGRGMASGHLRRFIIVQLVIQFWILVASCALYVADVSDTIWWMAVYAAPAPIVLALSFRRRQGSRERTSLRRVLLGTVDRRSATYMVGGLGILLAARTERLILSLLSSTEELGLYVAIATASEMLVWAAAGLGESRVIGFLTSPHSRASLAKAAVRDYAYFLVLAVPLAAAIRWLLLPLLGTAFVPAEVLIIPLCLSSAAWATYLQMSAVWLARGSAGQSLRLDMGAAVMTTLAVAALVPAHGALGAAWGCAAAYTFMVAVAVVLLPRLRMKEDSVDRP